MTSSPFQIRAGLEGFYGTFYTHPQRNDLIRFLAANGFTHYIYGPKSDRYHRIRWRRPYRDADLREFAHTVALAREAGLTFVYALSPGGSITYSSKEDFDLIRDKFHAFYEMGVREFSLFLDDIVPLFHSSLDEQVFGPAPAAPGPGGLKPGIGYAAAQADLCNRTYDWLKELDPGCTLSMCPTDYAGTAPFSDYLHQLGTHLYPAIDVFYTGPRVCSTTIDSTDAAAFGAAIQRPPLIWDNYPVNDLGMQYDMHIGPIHGRSADLYKSVRGVAVNLMLQPEASKVALHTFATYFADPHNYDPQAAWQAALRAVAGSDSAEPLHLFGENSLRSCLTGRDAEAKRMDQLAEDTLADLLQGVKPTQSRSLAALEEYLIKIDDACYHLSCYLPNLSLRQDLLPWIESLRWRHEMGRYALRTLYALEEGAIDGVMSRLIQRLKEAIAEVEQRPHRIGGKALLPLAHYTLEQTLRSRQGIGSQIATAEPGSSSGSQAEEEVL